MLGRVCAFIHNYFDKEVHEGEFTITNGHIDLPFLKVGQRFRIIGSDLNDGVYTYRGQSIYDDDNDSAVVLSDETFTGSIVTMTPPVDFINVCTEIGEWVNSVKAVEDSPYQSESFGGYSYTKSDAGTVMASGTVKTGWQTKFGSVLNQWRKIS